MKKLEHKKKLVVLIVLLYLIVSATIKSFLAIDPFSFGIALINLLVFHLVRTQYEEISSILYWWAWIYMIAGHGINAGAKLLVIYSGNSWEISKLTLGLDISVVLCGIIILLLLYSQRDEL